MNESVNNADKKALGRAAKLLLSVCELNFVM